MFPPQVTRAALHKELLLLFYKEVYQNGNLELIDELIAPDFRSHDWPEGLRGPQGFKSHYAAFKEALPQARYHLQDLIAESDRVVIRWEIRGVYVGLFPGIGLPPKGQKIAISEIAIYRIEKQMLQECWRVSNPYKVLSKTTPTCYTSPHNQ